MSEENNEKSCCTHYSIVFAHTLLRLWVGMRLFMAGLDKFRSGNGPTTTFSMENLTKKSDQIATLMSTNSFLPESMCKMFAASIPFPLVIVGIWVAVGLFAEVGLFVAGLLFLSLGFGLAALPDDTEVVVNIGISVLIVAAALATAKGKALSLDGLLFGRRRKSA